MLKKLLLFFLILGIGVSAFTAYYVWQQNLPLVSPLALLESTMEKRASPNKIVYGFLPYWNLKYHSNLEIRHLTHLAYFALDMQPDGTVKKKNNPREAEPGWNKINTPELQKVIYQSRLLGQKQVLTITAMDHDTINSLLADEQSFTNAATNILTEFSNLPFDSLNIDFEYVGTPEDSVINHFTQFITLLKESCKNIKKQCQIDIDVFADSARQKRLWDLKSLGPVVDHVIVMAYDYYRRSSTKAGPVSPLRGVCSPESGFSALLNRDSDCLDQDITTNIAEISSLIPARQLILGIPFYGYEWQTASTDYLSNTYPKTGSTIFYKDIISLFSNPEVSSLSAMWSTKSQSPYLTYYEKDKIFTVHYENPQSLSYKIKLIENTNMTGVAIWALGYEIPYLDIWQPITEYLTEK